MESKKMGAGKSLMAFGSTKFNQKDLDDDSAVSVFGIKGVVNTAPIKPTPQQFDLFVPWVCLQWCASTSVVIKRRHQVETKKLSPKMIRKGKRKTITDETQMLYDNSTTSDSFVDGEGFTHSGPMPIQAFYNNRDQLVEVAFIKCPIFSRKVIHALRLCVPYHYTLNRLSICKGGLTDELIYEISKLIPISNITEICFDDSFVREANYYILLEDYPQLKLLSLNRCRINDDACKKIILNIDFGTPACKSLQILELGSNCLTDVTAKLLGLVLRKNRCLLHLNLSGNQISDEGFEAIMGVLMPFPLTYDEVVQLRNRRLHYLSNRTAVYEKCLREVISRSHDDYESSTSSKKMITAARRLRKKSKKHVQDVSSINVASQAEVMTNRIVGDFKDPFCSESVKFQNGYRYSNGNMTLCSLNVAYNDLNFPSVQKLQKVVAYQYSQEKLPFETGLMRITLDGNHIPFCCSELDEINDYLKKMLDAKSSALLRKGRAASLRKITRSQVNI